MKHNQYVDRASGGLEPRLQPARSTCFKLPCKVFDALTWLMIRAKPACMKGKKAEPKKPTAGTITGAKYRARCNRLNDAQREKLGEEFLKLYYAGNAHQPALLHIRRLSASRMALSNASLLIGLRRNRTAPAPRAERSSCSEAWALRKIIGT